MSDYWEDFAKYARPGMVSGEEKGIMNQRTGQMVDGLQECFGLLERIQLSEMVPGTPDTVRTEATTRLAIAYALADIAGNLRTLVAQPKTGTGFSAQR